MLSSSFRKAKPDPDAEARRDREVRRLIEQQKRRGSFPMVAAVKVFPYRTLLAPPPGAPLRPQVFFPPIGDAVPEIAGVAVSLGFVPQDFSAAMRERILVSLRDGYSILLIGNNATLRDHGKREIALALREPAASP
jgi:hypothetical protein